MIFYFFGLYCIKISTLHIYKIYMYVKNICTMHSNAIKILGMSRE